jgi:tRNA dimethylallyltransferase
MDPKNPITVSLHLDKSFMTPGLIVICGPTATGKTELALHLAERLNVPIISADSRQVYQDFDIGTAKPSFTERSRVKHYMIDVYPPTYTLTVAEYQQKTQELIASFHQQEITPLLVGGTGLYIKAIVQGLRIPKVPPHPELRAQLQNISQSECYQWLQQVDAAAAAKIHSNDQVRTLRALEVFYVMGVPLSTQQTCEPPAFPIYQIGLDMTEPQSQADRIHRRIRHMLEQGWISELEGLILRYGLDLPLLNTLGYAELKRYLQGEFNLEQAQALAVTHTRQFAKRQRTWFRNQANIHWLEADTPNLVEQAWMQLKPVLG